MKKFDYSFLKKQSLPPNILTLLIAVEKETSLQRNLKYRHPKIFSSFMKTAIMQSIKSSSAIEGVVVSDERLEEIINEDITPMNKEEKQISGYRDVINEIHNDHDLLNLSDSLMLSMHRDFLSYENLSNAGKYKTIDNLIMEIDEEGNKKIRFKPTPAIETPKAMEQLCLAFAEAKDDALINQLLLIPCFILDFLCIHPFSAGNGRMSRLLTLLLLYKNDYDVGKYVSFENQINIFKNEYYEALRLSSIGWDDNKNDYNPFMENFLLTLLRCYKELDSRFSIIGEKKLNKKERIKETIFQSLIPISRKDICLMWPDISVNTVRKAITELHDKKIIEKIGLYKNAKYVKQK